MAQKTVIDELIVTLGLDPKNFKKGEKEAASALVDLKNKSNDANDTIQKGANKSSDAIMSFGKKALVVAAVLKTFKFITGIITDTASATYDLSNASRHLGESARHLRNFENIAEMMGGTADGARKSIHGLKRAIFDLTVNGQMSSQLVMLGRLGVQFQDGRGRARDFKSVYLDTAGALQRNVASGNMSEADALMAAEDAGFDPALARAMVGGRDAAQLALAQQEKRRQITDADTQAAAAVDQSVTGMGQAYIAAKEGVLVRGSGKVIALAHAGEGLANAGKELTEGNMQAAWDAWREGMGDVSMGLGNLAVASHDAAGALLGFARKAVAGVGREGYERQIQQSARKYGLNPEILAGVLNTESHFNPDAVSSAGARGIAQLMPQYFPDAGVDPMVDIDTAAGELARLKRSFMKTGSGESAAMDSALMAYNAGERRLRTSKVFGDGTGTALEGETIAYPGQVYEYAASREAAGGGSTTTVQIDAIHIQTAATDANGIAGNIADAVQRKLTAAQADPALR